MLCFFGNKLVFIAIVKYAFSSFADYFIVFKETHPFTPVWFLDLPMILRFFGFLKRFICYIDNEINNLRAYLDVESTPFIFFLPSQDLIVFFTIFKTLFSFDDHFWKLFQLLLL